MKKPYLGQRGKFRSEQIGVERGESMKRLATMSLMCLAISLATGLPTRGEEITLRDGTKIVGRMTGITSEKIEVETSYGKVQLNRSEIITINFPENGSAKAPETVKPELPKIDETLTDTQYVNRTGKFSLTLPPEWIINADLRRGPTTLAGLSSKDKTRFAIVTLEEYPGSLESYKELVILNARRTLGNFEELAESKTTIDGKAALVIFYRGVLKTNNLPVEFVTAIVPSGTSFTKIAAWSVEPLFHDMQPAFEKIVNSYRSTAPVAATR
jgi:hypothetical protein